MKYVVGLGLQILELIFFPPIGHGCGDIKCLKSEKSATLATFSFFLFFFPSSKSSEWEGLINYANMEISQMQA